MYNVGTDPHAQLKQQSTTGSFLVNITIADIYGGVVDVNSTRNAVPLDGGAPPRQFCWNSTLSAGWYSVNVTVDPDNEVAEPD